MTITPEQLQSMRCDATDGLNTGGQGTELLAKHVMVLAAEVERLRTTLVEAEHNVRTLRAECAGLTSRPRMQSGA